jgi:hypothetical protein
MNLLLKYISPSAAFSARKDFRRSSLLGSSVEGVAVALMSGTSTVPLGAMGI